MEMLLGLLSLVIIVGAVLGIIAFSKTRELERQLTRLRLEISLLQKPEAAPQTRAAQTQEPRKASDPVAPDTVQNEATVEEVPEPELNTGLEAKEPPVAQEILGSRNDGPAPSAQESPETERPTLSAPKPKERGFVDELGARWSVWVGGLALGLGAIFLLRYSIEAGVFSPGLRVALAVVLGLASLAAGEWLRRSDPAERSEALQHAYIPGVLTAVGILALFGSVYASYALYGFIGPTVAFGLMGILSLGALALGLRQGPALSGLGLAGSLLTPWLVSSAEPSYVDLYTYLFIVSAGALLLARYRGWTWLSCASVAGGIGWALIGFSLHLSDEFWPWTLYLAGLAGLTIALNAARRLPFTDQEPDLLQGKILPLTACAATGLLFTVMLYEDLFSLRAFYTCLAAAALGLTAAWHWGRLAGIAVMAGALATAAILSRGGEVVGGSWDWPAGGIFIPSPLEGEWAKVFIVAVAASIALIGAAAFGAKKHLPAPG